MRPNGSVFMCKSNEHIKQKHYFVQQSVTSPVMSQWWSPSLLYVRSAELLVHRITRLIKIGRARQKPASQKAPTKQVSSSCCMMICTPTVQLCGGAAGLDAAEGLLIHCLLRTGNQTETCFKYKPLFGYDLEARRTFN